MLESVTVFKVDTKQCIHVRALSGESVVSSHSVIATGLVSRHRVEFDTWRVCRFCELEAVGFAILGALKCLQTGRALHRKQF